VEKIVDRIVEKPLEKVVEKIVEKPVERIVDRIVERPVDRVVYRDREVPVEKIVEKVVEKPVERVVYRDREVPVEKVVEKIVDRVVEKPVEKIVYRDRPAPAKKAAPAKKRVRRERKPDDLKRIFGVGPVLEKFLHKNGIKWFRQVAKWDRKDIEKFEEKLPNFQGRIEREGWVRSAVEEHYKKYGKWLGTGIPRITKPETR
jgi:predicted flap endonuclease-1-like 5' DNA nuclease